MSKSIKSFARRHLIWLLTAIAAVLLVVAECGPEFDSNAPIAITVEPLKTVYNLGAPITARVTVTNKSSQPVAVSCPHPMSRDIIFTRLWPLPAFSAELRRSYPSKGYVPVVLKPGETFGRVCFINRHFGLSDSCTYGVHYRLTLQFHAWDVQKNERVKPAIRQAASASGILWLKVRKVEDALVVAELESYLRQLTSHDIEQHNEALGALRHLRTPLAVPILKRALESHCNPDFVFAALAHIGTPGAIQIIEAAISSPDYDAVYAALRELARKKRFIGTESLVRFLSNKDPVLRAAGIEYLRELRSSKYLDLAKPLVNDPDPSVSAGAREYIRHAGEYTR